MRLDQLELREKILVRFNVVAVLDFVEAVRRALVAVVVIVVVVPVL